MGIEVKEVELMRRAATHCNTINTLQDMMQRNTLAVPSTTLRDAKNLGHTATQYSTLQYSAT